VPSEQTATEQGPTTIIPIESTIQVTSVANPSTVTVPGPTSIIPVQTTIQVTSAANPSTVTLPGPTLSTIISVTSSAAAVSPPAVTQTPPIQVQPGAAGLTEPRPLVAALVAGLGLLIVLA
jgi:hypothetical protein